MTKNDPSTQYTAKKRPKFGQKSPNITWQLLNPSENQLKIYFKGPKLSKNWGKHPDLIFDWQKYLKMTLGLLKRPENPLKLGKNTKKWPKNIKYWPKIPWDHLQMILMVQPVLLTSQHSPLKTLKWPMNPFKWPKKRYNSSKIPKYCLKMPKMP